MSDLPATPRPPSSPLGSAWSRIWVRAAVLFVVWVAIAIFLYAISTDHVRPAHQALLIVSWGIVGVAFGALWFVIEGGLASWMDRAGTEHRDLIAVGFYLVFLVVLIVALAVVSNGSDPDDWHFMAYLSFLIVAGLPSTGFMERVKGSSR